MKGRRQNMKDMTHAAARPENTEPRIDSTPNLEEIRQRAYEIFLAREGVHGKDQDDWLQAERQLTEKPPTS